MSDIDVLFFTNNIEEIINQSGIYFIMSIIDGKKYIGSSCTIRRRLKDHINKLNKNKHGNNHLQNAWNKYGKENFLFGILNICDKFLLIQNEQKYLDLYKTYCPNIGYNIRKYADITIAESPNKEQRKRISDSLKEWYKTHDSPNKGRKLTKEQIEVIRQSNLGRTLTEDHKKKIAEALKDRQYTKETIDKMSDSKIKWYETHDAPMKGKRFSDDHKNKIKEARIKWCNENKEKMCGRKMSQYVKDILSQCRKEQVGQNAPMYGKKHTEDTKNKMRSYYKRKPFVCNETKEMFQSTGDASRALGIRSQGIGQCLNKIIWQTAGYTFRYVDEPEIKKPQKSRFRCNETGDVFQSTIEAAKSLNINYSKILECLKGNRKSTYGYTFSYIE